MSTHKDARLTLHGRVLLISRVLTEGLRPTEATQAQGVSGRTVYKWLSRYRQEGEAGLHNRSWRPRRCRTRLAVSCVLGSSSNAANARPIGRSPTRTASGAAPWRASYSASA